MAAGAKDGGFGLMGWIAGGSIALAAGIGGLYFAGVFDPETALDVAPATAATPDETDTTTGPDNTTQGSEPEPKTQAQESDQATSQEPVADPVPTLLAPGFDVVRVDTDGNTVIAGTATPGSRVTIYLDGQIQASTVVDRSGAFVSLLTVPPSDTARVLTMTAQLDGQQRPADDQIILTPTVRAVRAEPEPQIAEAQTEQTTPTSEMLAENSDAESATEPAATEVGQDTTVQAASDQTTPDPVNPAPSGNTQTASANPENDTTTTQTAEPAQVAQSETDQPPAATENTATETGTKPPEGIDVAQALPPDPADTTTAAPVPAEKAQVVQSEPKASDPSPDAANPSASDGSVLAQIEPAQTDDDRAETDQANVVADIGTPESTPETTTEITVERQTQPTPMTAEVQQAEAQPGKVETGETQSLDPGTVEPAPIEPLVTADTTAKPLKADPVPAIASKQPDPAQDKVQPPQTTPPLKTAEIEATPDAGSKTVAQDAQAEEPAKVAVTEPALAKPEPVEPAPNQPPQAENTVIALADPVPVPAVEPSDPQPVEKTPTVAAVQSEAIPEPAPEPPAEIAAIVASEPDTALAPVAVAEPAPTPTPAPDPASAAPAAPVTVLRAGADGIEVLQSGSPVPEVMDKIALDTISYSQAGEIQLSGRAQLQSVIRVYLDNKAVGDLVTDETGRWSGLVEDITPGIYTLRLDELGQGGDVLSRIETPFKRESPEVLRPPTDPGTVARDDTADGGPTPLIRAVTVQRGDTLWAISRERYGAGVLYVRVFEANRRDIRDPDLIYPGQVFKLPE